MSKVFTLPSLFMAAAVSASFLAPERIALTIKAMENTGNVLFEDDVPQWYVALGDRWAGPLTAADVYRKVVSQEISWAHYVWKPGQPDWKRICDLKNFQVAVPQLPGKSVQSEVKEAAKPEIKQVSKKATEPRIWFLFYNDSQFGPFSKSEIDRSLTAGKINGRVFVWKDGMAEWVRLEQVSDFAEAVENLKAAARPPEPPKKPNAPEPEKKVDQRVAPRRPLVAKIMMANEDSILTGVCRDISIGGMQVLTDRIPGSVGKRIKLNVSAEGQIEPFVAQGVIVRVLEDQRGFSFRFDRLSDESRKSIEAYINAPGI